jgi:cytidylate kinase
MTPFVVAIDGPAGAGKSTVSRTLARALGFAYVDTGAMYRIIGVLAHERGIDMADASALAALCDATTMVFDDRDDGIHTLADGRDLSTEIRAADAGQWASKVSAVPAVRERLVAMQRTVGASGRVVMEGRDIGTVVFPQAPVKVFLTASAEERARRRCAELAARGVRADVAAVAREITERDQRDQNRAHSPLRPAADALVIDSTQRRIDDIVTELQRVVIARQNPCK